VRTRAGSPSHARTAPSTTPTPWRHPTNPPSPCLAERRIPGLTSIGTVRGASRRCRREGFLRLIEGQVTNTSAVLATSGPAARREASDGKLIYSAITSLDGYIEDAEGKVDWAEPDEEVHAFVNDLERPVGTYLYGRRMYETMVFWENPPELTAQPPFTQDFAGIWQRADKIVYSETLQTVTSAKTLIERDPPQVGPGGALRTA
jgi:hypothetical protein